MRNKQYENKISCLNSIFHTRGTYVLYIRKSMPYGTIETNFIYEIHSTHNFIHNIAKYVLIHTLEYGWLWQQLHTFRCYPLSSARAMFLAGKNIWLGDHCPVHRTIIPKQFRYIYNLFKSSSGSSSIPNRRRISPILQPRQAIDPWSRLWKEHLTWRSWSWDALWTAPTGLHIDRSDWSICDQMAPLTDEPDDK